MSPARPAGLWSRRGLAAALAPGLLCACADGPATRPMVLVNLLDTAEPGPVPPAPPLGTRVGADDTGARLESAFDQARRMTVPVRVNGKGPFSFVVDTGANRSVVSREVAAICALPPAGRTDVHGIAGVEPADLAQVDYLRVGGVSANHLTLPVLNRAQLGADGILGVDILRGRLVFLDFVGNRFEIAASGGGAEIGRERGSRLSDPNLPVSVPAQYRFGQLVILDASVAGVRVSAFLDSGSQVTVGNHALRDAVINIRPDFGPRLAPVPLISATGQTAEGQFAPLPALRLGGMEVREILAVFADLHIFDLWQLKDRPAILIGIDVLRHFRDVTLDFGRKQVIFSPAPPGRRPPPGLIQP